MIPLHRIIRIFCVSLLVGFCLFGLSLLVLPGLIESWMLPQLLKQQGYDDFTCRIAHLGLTETSAGPLHFGPGPEPALSVERINLIYSPASITKGELDQVILSGVSIKAVINKDGLILPILDLKNKPSQENSDNKPKPSPPGLSTPSQLPVPPFTRLTIKQSVLLIQADNREFRIPFTCTIKRSTAPESAATLLDGTLLLNPRGTQVTLNFTLPLNGKEPAHLKLEGNNINLLDFADIWSRIPGLNVKGQITLNAEANLNLTPPGLKDLQARIEWKQGQLAFNNFHIGSSQSAAGTNSTTILTVNKEEAAVPWQLQINRLALMAPFSPTITNLKCTIKDEPDKIELQSHWITRLAGYDKASGLTFKQPFTKKWQLTAEIDQQGGYQAELSSPADGKRWQLGNDRLSISGRSPAIKVNAHAQDSDLKKINWLISLNQTVINNAGSRLHFPEIKAEGQTEVNSSKQSFVNTPVSATKASFTCRKIILNKTDLGRFNATLKQKGEKFNFKGLYASELIKELKLIVKGDCEIKQTGGFQAEASLTVPDCKSKRPIILRNFLPAAGKSTIDGTFSAAGKIAYGRDNQNQLSGDLTLKLNHARLKNPDKNLECSGINCRIKFPNFPSLYSSPNQKLTFTHLQVGNIISPGGSLSFQVERDQTLLLEKGRIGWCGGNIETQALRISPDTNHYQSTLYCDRLLLTELLKQLGQIEAQGEGSVNGRIPISWVDGKISFNDGFLYSTPNQPGNIKIKGGAALTAGVPADSPEFAQLDLASEALKDYQYKCAKLKLNSQADELFLNLKLDGKPNLPLPFIYKKELGSFIRISTGPGSHFQGISLDINLRLPLNHILQYKDLSTILK